MFTQSRFVCCRKAMCSILRKYLYTDIIGVVYDYLICTKEQQKLNMNRCIREMMVCFHTKHMSNLNSYIHEKRCIEYKQLTRVINSLMFRKRHIHERYKHLKESEVNMMTRTHYINHTTCLNNMLNMSVIMKMRLEKIKRRLTNVYNQELYYKDLLWDSKYDTNGISYYAYNIITSCFVYYLRNTLRDDWNSFPYYKYNWSGIQRLHPESLKYLPYEMDSFREFLDNPDKSFRIYHKYYYPKFYIYDKLDNFPNEISLQETWYNVNQEIITKTKELQYIKKKNEIIRKNNTFYDNWSFTDYSKFFMRIMHVKTDKKGKYVEYQLFDSCMLLQSGKSYILYKTIKHNDCDDFRHFDINYEIPNKKRKRNRKKNKNKKGSICRRNKKHVCVYQDASNSKSKKDDVDEHQHGSHCEYLNIVLQGIYKNINMSLQFHAYDIHMKEFNEIEQTS